MTPLESGLLLTIHCLDPAEGFLDPLADTLADRIAGVARRAPWRVAVSVSGAPPVSTAIPWEIEDEDARIAAGGPLEHVGMAERMHRIAIAGEPTFLNGPAGEFVVFGRAFGGSSAGRRGSLGDVRIVWPPTPGTPRPRPA